MIVVDTNVIAYFLIRGEQTALAEKVRRKEHEWAAPSLWRSEMRNLLALYERRKLLTLSKAFEIMEEAEQVMVGREYYVDSNHVLELAASTGCTAYDCEFVSLAVNLGVKLVTSDKKLLSAFPEIAVSMEAFAGR